MMFAKKSLISAVSMGVLAVFASFEAKAAESKILIKVENVKSLKDVDGLVNACEFDVVVYNRSPEDVVSGDIDLVWKDSTVTNIVNQEEKDARQNPTQQRSVTRDADTLNVGVQLPELKSFKQVILRSSMKTDRCFLLVDEAKVSAKRCNSQLTVASDKAGVSPVSRTKNCPGFEFVSSKNPQFYKEFKKITPEEERELNMTEQAKVRDTIEQEYQNTLSVINETSNILQTVK